MNSPILGCAKGSPPPINITAFIPHSINYFPNSITLSFEKLLPVAIISSLMQPGHARLQTAVGSNSTTNGEEFPVFQSVSFILINNEILF